jgi:hypothetical protein
MEKNTFDAPAIVLVSSFVADSVNAFQPGRSTETRSTSQALSRIGREANPVFKAVDVLGVVPNQLAGIAQTTDEMVRSCRTGALSRPTHVGDVPVEKRPSLRIEEDRRMEKMTIS